VDCQAVCGGSMSCCTRTCGSKCSQCLKLTQSSASAPAASGPVSRTHHKSHPCERLLYCQHRCGLDCSSDHKCNPKCGERCRQACLHHRCSKDCWEPCAPCMEPCQWNCAHLTCPVLCGSVRLHLSNPSVIRPDPIQICSRVPCDEPCRQKLSCDHPCPSGKLAC